MLKITININSDLIDEFREKVNENNFFYNLYKDNDGKNKWNIVCSAMDWLSVVSNGLPQINLENTDSLGVNHSLSLNLMQYIVSVDILLESIKQIYRVLYDNNNYPLKNDKSIFQQNKISDEKYFKHIRAVFGTHQVNLNSVDGIRKNDNERFYSSWSVSSIFDDNNNFKVNLYSNMPDKEDEKFKINIKKINEFAKERYILLNDFTNRVDTIIKNHISNKKTKIISESDNNIEQLKILKKENRERIGAEYGYAYEINYIYRLLKVEVKDDKIKSIIKEYRDHLIKQIHKIKNNLQNMNFNYTLEKPQITDYETGKIHDYFYRGNKYGKECFEYLISKGILPSYLNRFEDLNEKELIYDSIIYYKSEQLTKSLKYNDLLDK